MKKFGWNSNPSMVPAPIIQPPPSGNKRSTRYDSGSSNTNRSGWPLPSNSNRSGLPSPSFTNGVHGPKEVLNTDGFGSIGSDSEEDNKYPLHQTDCGMSGSMVDTRFVRVPTNESMLNQSWMMHSVGQRPTETFGLQAYIADNKHQAAPQNSNFRENIVPDIPVYPPYQDIFKNSNMGFPTNAFIHQQLGFMENMHMGLPCHLKVSSEQGFIQNTNTGPSANTGYWSQATHNDVQHTTISPFVNEVPIKLVPDGTGSLKYPPPDPNLLTFEPEVGYLYDANTGLHYDANSGYFFNSKLRIFLQWDFFTQTYLRVENPLIPFPVLKNQKDSSENQQNTSGTELIEQHCSIELEQGETNQDELSRSRRCSRSGTWGHDRGRSRSRERIASYSQSDEQRKHQRGFCSPRARTSPSGTSRSPKIPKESYNLIPRNTQRRDNRSSSPSPKRRSVSPVSSTRKRDDRRRSPNNDRARRLPRSSQWWGTHSMSPPRLFKKRSASPGPSPRRSDNHNTTRSSGNRRRLGSTHLHDLFGLPNEPELPTSAGEPHETSPIEEALTLINTARPGDVSNPCHALGVTGKRGNDVPVSSNQRNRPRLSGAQRRKLRRQAAAASELAIIPEDVNDPRQAVGVTGEGGNDPPAPDSNKQRNRPRLLGTQWQKLRREAAAASGQAIIPRDINDSSQVSGVTGEGGNDTPAPDPSYQGKRSQFSGAQGQKLRREAAAASVQAVIPGDVNDPSQVAGVTGEGGNDPSAPDASYQQKKSQLSGAQRRKLRRQEAAALGQAIIPRNRKKKAKVTEGAPQISARLHHNADSICWEPIPPHRAQRRSNEPTWFTNSWASSRAWKC